MVIPADALTKLAAVDADVVYSLYCSRHSGMWLCFPHINGYKGVSLSADRVQAQAAWGRVLPSEGAGFGCMLIHRRVLEQVSFRSVKRRNFADDWPFALDVKAAGLRSAHDLSVVCGHLLHEGGVMWPDIDAPNFYRVEGAGVAHPHTTTLAEIATYRCRRVLMGERIYRRGEMIELNAETAAVLLNRGAIEIVEEA